MIILAAIIATLVGMLALSLGAVTRGLTLLIIAALLTLGPRFNRGVAVWITGYWRPVIAGIVLALAGLAMFWPTRLFIVDYMTAVPP